MIASLKERAGELGFIAIGFSRPERPLFFNYFRKWLADGKNGNMAWLERHLNLRENPAELLDGCQTIITLAYPYSSTKPCTPDGYTTARYTEPGKPDYHKRLKKLARELKKIIVEAYPGTRSRICVDSAPILERSFAYASHIGFIGKNNMLIIPEYGSYIFLLEILTTHSFHLPKTHPIENMCGSCTRCVDACPTGALDSPFHLDASKCLSYLTIEYPGEVNIATGDRMGDCFFGCDICQEACPFNKGALLRNIFLPLTDEILRMDTECFDDKFGKTAFARSGLDKLKGNIRALRSRDS